jgi:hypothetical protein
MELSKRLVVNESTAQSEVVGKKFRSCLRPGQRISRASYLHLSHHKQATVLGQRIRRASYLHLSHHRQAAVLLMVLLSSTTSPRILQAAEVSSKNVLACDGVSI